MTQTGVSQRVVVAFCRVAFICLLLAMSSPSWADDHVLTVGAGGLYDYDNIQSAINAAEDGDTILVHPGTYTGSGDAVVKIIGTATEGEGLQPGDTLTITSTSGPEVTFIDGGSTVGKKRRGIMWQDINGTLDGFTIQNCKWQTPQSNNDSGAGMLVKDTGTNNISVSVKACVFWGNVNDNGNGGGLAMDLKYTASDTVPDEVVPCVVEDCVFTKNYSRNLNGIGAGMWITGASIEIRHTEFTENNPGPVRRKATGVGLGAENSVAVITDSSFTNNVSGIDNGDQSGEGGGAWFFNCSLELSRCTFRENKVETGVGGGLAIGNRGDQTVVITECVIESNMPEQGGGKI